MKMSWKNCLVVLATCISLTLSAQQTAQTGQTGQKIQADMIVINGTIYTMDAEMSTQRYMVIVNGKVAVVSNSPGNIFDRFESKNILNLDGKYIYPGFNDAHCHFYGLGLNLLQANLKGATSYEEMLKKFSDYVQENKDKKFKWILGRGWDQNLWANKQFPTKEKLDSMFPKIPVMLKRVDGHAALVNSKALKAAKITAQTKVAGGEIVLGADGQPTGLLIDNAVDIVERKLPKPKAADMENALLAAEKICVANGLTSVQDAGLDYAVVKKMEEMYTQGKLNIRMYAMLNPTEENFKNYMSKGPLRKGNLHIQSVKLYADGALGSRGACLLQPYSDKPNHYGLMLNDTAYLRSMARRVFAAGYQLNTHCIGDSANRVMLNIYGEILKGENDRRWRIEHAQIVHPGEWLKFKRYSIIPSVQPTHVSSDKNWVPDRIGNGRLDEAYPYKKLLMFSGRIALGTDFPVEEVNPMGTLFSAVMRTTRQEHPAGMFQYQNALTLYEAMKGMTYWAAYAQHEENEKGCLENNRFADFIVLDKDIMKGNIAEVFNAKVLYTFIAGKKVYEAK